MRIAVCDDAPISIGSIEAMLKQYSIEHLHAIHSISTFLSANALLCYLEESNTDFDLYLLDIMMGDQNGIELAKNLRARGFRGKIVFLTASPDYALSAFSVKAAGYLLKPVNPEDLFPVLDEAVEDFHLRRSSAYKFFSFRTPDGIFTTTFQEILYVEVMGHTPYYHLARGSQRGSEMRISFEDSMAELIQSGCFVRPHRSYLVNAAHIISIGTGKLTLDNGASIPVARMRIAETKAAYRKYLNRNVPSKT